MAILVRIARIIGLVDEIFQFSQRGGQQRLIRAHTEVMAVNFEEAYLRHTDDFAPWLEAQELRERLLGHLATDSVDAGLHQQTNGGYAGPSKHFPGKLEGAFVAVSLRNAKAKPPTLPLGFPMEAKLMRPCHRLDAILGHAHPT